jgi:hypothetical protein
LPCIYGEEDEPESCVTESGLNATGLEAGFWILDAGKRQMQARKKMITPNVVLELDVRFKHDAE